jgi:hypothetical protein
MSRGAQSFTQADLTKAVKGVVKAGVQVGRVEITAGKITVFAGRAGVNEAEIEVTGNEWDGVK